MLLKEVYTKRDSFPLLVSIFFFLILIFTNHFEYEKYAVVAIVGGLLFVSFFLDVRFLYYTYFVSFFLGTPVIQYFPLVVNVTDIFFPILLAARFAPHILFRKSISSFKPDKRILFFMIMLLVVGIFAYGCNFIDRSIKLKITGIWFLYRLFQAILIFIIFSDKEFKINLFAIYFIFIIMTLIQLPITIIQQMDIGNILVIKGVTGTFYAHHAHMGTFMIIPFFLSLYFFTEVKKKKLKFLIIIFMLITVYLIFLSECRSAIFGLFISLFIYTLMHLKLDFKRIAAMGLVLIGVIVFLYLSPFLDIIQRTFQSKDTGTIDLSSFSRILIWRDSLVFFLNENILQKILGIGIGFSREILEISFFFKRDRFIPSSHNNYLTALIETGIIGLFAFIYLYYLILCKLYKTYKYNNNNFALSIFFVTIAFLGSCLTQETFGTDSFLGSTLLCYYTFVALALKEETASNENSNSR